MKYLVILSSSRNTAGVFYHQHLDLAKATSKPLLIEWMTIYKVLQNHCGNFKM